MALRLERVHSDSRAQPVCLDSGSVPDFSATWKAHGSSSHQCEKKRERVEESKRERKSTGGKTCARSA